MSHFSVLVIGKNVEQQLAPYHEFECTGTDDQYVQNIDITEEARSEFANDTTTCLKAADGTLHSFFDDEGNWRLEFSQPDANASQFDPHRRTRFVPEGYEEIEVPRSQVESFAQWIRGYYGARVVLFGEQPDLAKMHKYGYVLVDEAGDVVKVIKRTNPNKRWDYWTVGGRWPGFLKLKGAAGDVDTAKKGEIDFDGMRDAAGAKAAEQWDRAAVARDGRTWVSWAHMRDVLHPDNIDAAREAYNAQRAVQALGKLFNNPFHDIDAYLAPRDEFIQAARDRAISSYAVVKDGQWSAKGEMGWFGMSADKMSEDDWNKRVSDLLDGLPDDTQITVVDCHI